MSTYDDFKQRHPWALRWAQITLAVSEWFTWHFNRQKAAQNLIDQGRSQAVVEGEAEVLEDGFERGYDAGYLDCLYNERRRDERDQVRTVSAGVDG